jgi:hypothetical protein
VPEIQVGSEDAGGKIGGGVSVKAAGGAGLAVGPFYYRVKKAKIQHTSPGNTRVAWRISGAEFFQEDSPDLVVVIQVPKKVKDVQVDCVMQAYRNFSFAVGNLSQAITALPEWMQMVFKTGNKTPPSAKKWDLSPVLK